MVATTSKVVLPSNVEIADKDGKPTSFFVRQLQALLDEKADVATAANTAQSTADGKVSIGQVAANLLSEMGGDPAANKLLYWNDTANAFQFLGIGTNLTITAGFLNASGGGGGGGNWWAGLSTPVAASFTLVSGDATNGIMADDTNVGLTFDGNTPVASNKIRAAEKAIANPNADWTYTVHSNMFIPDTSFSSVGIYCRDSVGGKLLFLGLGQNKAIQVNRATLAAFTSTPITFGWAGSPAPSWWRIKWLNATSTFEFYVSVDGKVWAKLGTETLAAFITNKATQVGFGVSTNRTTGPNGVLSIDYLAIP